MTTTEGRGRGRRARVGALLAAMLVGGACRNDAKPSPVVVRNPDYLVVRSIRREADAEHTTRVELPYSGAGFGFASSATLLDLTSFDLGAVAFAGGRTSIAGEASLWLPLTPEGNRRLEAWSGRHAGDYLGIFLEGRLVAAPRINTQIGGGIPLRVTSKSEGDRLIEALRTGGVAR